MKFDTNKKMTLGAKRTLKEVTAAFLAILRKKSFDSIQVQEICEISMIPRATFYNYFDDKYDLLQYCFYCLEQMVYPNFDAVMDHCDDLEMIINNLLDIADKYRPVLDEIIKKNPTDAGLYKEFSSYFINTSMRSTYSCTLKPQLSVPPDMVAKMYAYAFLTVFEWAYIEKNEAPREELLRYINVLTDYRGLLKKE